MTEAISGSGRLLEENGFGDGVESRFSEGTESLGSGDERKGEESCGCSNGGGGGVSERVGAWGSMIGEVELGGGVDVGRLEYLMHAGACFFFFLPSFLVAEGRPSWCVGGVNLRLQSVGSDRLAGSVY